MKITVESTSKLVQFEIGGTMVPARIWEGFTEDGIPVHCYITRICPTIPEPLPEAIAANFAKDLSECVPPSAAVRAIPLRMIL
jgi:hypothetical protein